MIGYNGKYVNARMLGKHGVLKVWRGYDGME